MGQSCHWFTRGVFEYCDFLCTDKVDGHKVTSLSKEHTQEEEEDVADEITLPSAQTRSEGRKIGGCAVRVRISIEG